MEFIRKSSENEMIAVFLEAEINSHRFSGELLNALDKYKATRMIVTAPNIEDEAENEIRRGIIGEYRGYGRNELLFESFPECIHWNWVALSKPDIENIKYIDYSYWVELSRGSRLAKDAAQNIKDGKEVFNVKNHGFFEASKALINGTLFPPMILLSSYEEDYLVVLEGHLRLTAYMLEPNHIPERLHALIGYASDSELTRWGMY